MEEVNDSSDKASDKPMECDDEEEIVDELTDPIVERICITGNLAADHTVVEAARTFGSVVELSDGSQWLDSVPGTVVFVLEDFFGERYEDIRRRNHTILGPTALKEYALKSNFIPAASRPIYSLSMAGLVLCFTGFRIKDELSRIVTLVHSMGGSVRKDLHTDVTHLISNNCMGQKCVRAALFRVPIMSATWVHDAWAMRTQVGFSATFNMAEHKLKPFFGARVCFLGFPAEEQSHMAEILIENGGVVTDIDDSCCSHVVLDESSGTSAPSQTPSKASLVRAEWFWASVQKQLCEAETNYLVKDSGSSSPGGKLSLGSTPGSIRARKRKRINLKSSLGSPSVPETPKRRSSISDANFLSCSGSFLDSSPHPDIDEVEEIDEEPHESPKKKLSARHQVFLELLQTESNYVGILNTIVSLFKAPLEEMIEGDDPLLNATEIKIIFGNLPPIYHTHCQMLERLKHAAQNWTEDVSVGNIILKSAADMLKSYPPFVNFFENTREMLNKCDESKQRFHAFLKGRQTKPECGRQTLQELLIRPVQRLPSVSLLLNDLLKHTNKNNPDYSALDKALSSIKEVMTYINEDKRRTEGQMVIFNIFNDIENCPAHIISSHRMFINKCDVFEVSDSLSKKGDPLVLYLFSDMLEVCKKRAKCFNNLKSPNATLNSKVSNCKPYKHIKLMSLATIKRVINIRDTDECKNVFALMCYSTTDLKEKLYIFCIMDEEFDKMLYLKTLCRHTANNACMTDAENFLASVDAETLDIDMSISGTGTLSKAFKFASRTRSKVGRAFSFNKTPSKLKRAVSTMMSPFGSTTNLTPTNQLSQMRLASCANITELSGSTSQYAPATPLSVQPTRRSKHSSVLVPALKRL